MRILHVFRSPVGGLFRHVRDLAKAQAAMGHQVGLVCDSITGGGTAAQLLESCKPFCTLGISTLPIPRLPAPADARAISDVTKMAREAQADVIHCHGAKGGLVGRIAARRLHVPSVYTPHGGSLHYAWKSPVGAAFLAAEKMLARIGSGFVFVCDFERTAFTRKIGLAGRPSVVAFNGLWPEEFAEIPLAPEATDLVFVGEVRRLKGIDMLLQAVAALKPERAITLTVVGDGPELDEFRAMAASLGLASQVNFAGRLPIAKALSLGRVMVIPSRAESFPYVVLETAAAARTMLATAVGGIPEILPASMTCQPDAASIAESLRGILANLSAREAEARALSTSIRDRFSARRMAETITNFYIALGA